MYEPRSGDLSVESRLRTPIKGLRTKLRTFLRSQGTLGKFRTDIRRRDGAFVVFGNITGAKPTEYDGRSIFYSTRDE